MPLEDERTNRLSFEVSPDGKYLYQFGPKIKILQTSDFKVVDNWTWRSRISAPWIMSTWEAIWT